MEIMNSSIELQQEKYAKFCNNGDNNEKNRRTICLQMSKILVIPTGLAIH